MMWKEFKAFAFKGNVLDLAIAVVVGTAFGKIVTSIVNDLIMPVVGMIIGGLDFSSLAVQLGDAKLAYGSLIQNIINFLIIAVCMFLFIQLINRTKKREDVKEAKPPAPSNEEVLLAEIRDLLRDNKA